MQPQLALCVLILSIRLMLSTSSIGQLTRRALTQDMLVMQRTDSRRGSSPTCWFSMARGDAGVQTFGRLQLRGGGKKSPNDGKRGFPKGEGSGRKEEKDGLEWRRGVETAEQLLKQADNGRFDDDIMDVAKDYMDSSEIDNWEALYQGSSAEGRSQDSSNAEPDEMDLDAARDAMGVDSSIEDEQRNRRRGKGGRVRGGGGIGMEDGSDDDEDEDEDEDERGGRGGRGYGRGKGDAKDGKKANITPTRSEKRVQFSTTPSPVHRYPSGQQEWYTEDEISVLTREEEKYMDRTMNHPHGSELSSLLSDESDGVNHVTKLSPAKEYPKQIKDDRHSHKRRPSQGRSSGRRDENSSSSSSSRNSSRNQASSSHSHKSSKSHRHASPSKGKGGGATTYGGVGRGGDRSTHSPSSKDQTPRSHSRDSRGNGGERMREGGGKGYGHKGSKSKSWTR